MLKYLENKQTVHIVAEIVVLLGLVFYFNSKVKRLSKYIEDISFRLEQQEDEIAKNTQMIYTLSSQLSKLNPGQPQSQIVTPRNEVTVPSTTQSKKSKKVRFSEPNPLSEKRSPPQDESFDSFLPSILPMMFSMGGAPPPRQQRNSSVVEITEEKDETINESDLDAELEEEMKALSKNPEQLD